ITEHLATHSHARTLFATHYHELTELSELVPGVRNLHCAVKEWEGGIVFLRRIREGGTDRSYGLHVAQIAGIPDSVLQRAEVVLHGLEASTEAMERGLAPAEGVTLRPSPAQGLLFDPAPPRDEAAEAVAEEIRELDPDSMTPLQALQALHAMRRRLIRDRE
ncbi:MAG: MutS-related protein, partial [Planctomycetota bacterium]